jgi:hypothetical protein
MRDNPIPYTSIFHTPENSTELMEWIGDLDGTSRTAAMTAACMALNLSHKLVNKWEDQNQKVRPTQESLI